ncbi:hypothetical protein RvY_12177-1 [Ramazzottius varieornatus]|uniref:Uncharacterized protein n=1 Tax=Ramazzottius varieornatus TaxID=947166 RepID=A0A1D1VSE4_RAMVA|nr:hypothetical protein RvY_12177-1 [Ramazzottius varieornatus]
MSISIVLSLAVLLMCDASPLQPPVSDRRTSAETVYAGSGKTKELLEKLDIELGSLVPNVLRCNPKNWVQCDTSPCHTSHCSNVPKAICLEERCYSCYAKYFTVAFDSQQIMRWTDVTTQCALRT